jgi:hypothetical protein
MFPFVIQMGEVVMERELKLRQALQAMGLHDTAYWLSWHLYIYPCILSLSSRSGIPASHCLCFPGMVSCQDNIIGRLRVRVTHSGWQLGREAAAAAAGFKFKSRFLNRGRRFAGPGSEPELRSVTYLSTCRSP